MPLAFINILTYLLNNIISIFLLCKKKGQIGTQKKNSYEFLD